MAACTQPDNSFHGSLTNYAHFIAYLAEFEHYSEILLILRLRVHLFSF